MFLLNTTMLREKFTLHEKDKAEPPVVAVGNRIALPLMGSDGGHEERLVVRGQNMHTTLRMAAVICRSYNREGPLSGRLGPSGWKQVWDDSLSGFERENNAKSWIAVYSGGRPLFKSGENHPFLDVIEQCDARNRDEYDRAVDIAEGAFNMAGRGVSIDHETTIAMVIGALAEKTRIGLIYRQPRHNTTFNFSVDAKQGAVREIAHPQPHQCLMHAAAWLEIIQLAVNSGYFKAKKGLTRMGAPPLEIAQQRLGKLNAELQQFEEMFLVRYRPERPDILTLIDDVESYASGY